MIRSCPEILNHIRKDTFSKSGHILRLSRVFFQESFAASNHMALYPYSPPPPRPPVSGPSALAEGHLQTSHMVLGWGIKGLEGPEGPARVRLVRKGLTGLRVKTGLGGPAAGFICSPVNQISPLAAENPRSASQCGKSRHCPTATGSGLHRGLVLHPRPLGFGHTGLLPLVLEPARPLLAPEPFAGCSFCLTSLSFRLVPGHFLLISLSAHTSPPP
uniref:Uncharacterized protein n=1 Tax=Rousettus aegyptiacus TaxID=9407 RepID=A0A7J8H0Q4_ROUAE|nr:hypothetical protein HJG63_011171 [Rousettus aegyptiacus]